MAIKSTYLQGKSGDYKIPLIKLLYKINFLKRIGMSVIPPKKIRHLENYCKKTEKLLNESIEYLEGEVILRNYTEFPESLDINTFTNLSDTCIDMFCKYDFIYFTQLDIKANIKHDLEKDIETLARICKGIEEASTIKKQNSDYESEKVDLDTEKKEMISITTKFLVKIKNENLSHEDAYDNIAFDFVFDFPKGEIVIIDSVMRDCF